MPTALFVLRSRRRDRSTWVVVMAFAIGLAAQIDAALFGSASDTSVRGHTHVFTVPGLYVLRVLDGALVGDRWLQNLWIDHGSATTIILGCLFFVFVVPLFIRTDSWPRAIAILAAAESILVFFAAVSGRGTVDVAPRHGRFTFVDARFAYVSILLIMVAVFVLVGHARLRPVLRALLITTVAAGFFVVAGFAYRWTNDRFEDQIGPRKSRV